MATGLELPAAIIGLAGAIGVADVAVKGVSTVYRHIRELKDVPANLQDIRDEIAALGHATSSLDGLKSADDKTKGIVNKSGLASALQQCGESCAALESDLQLWTRKGEHKLRSKVEVKANKAKIEKYLANIKRAREFVVLTSVALLLAMKVEDRSAEENARKAREQMDAVAERAKADHQRAEKEKEALNEELKSDLEEVEEREVEAALLEKEAEVKVYEDIMVRSARVEEQLTQTLGKVKGGHGSSVTVGMPASVVRQVKKQAIGDVEFGDNSTGQVGIYR